MDMIYGSANILKHGFIGHEEVTKFDTRRGPTVQTIIDNTSSKRQRVLFDVTEGV